MLQVVSPAARVIELREPLLPSLISHKVIEKTQICGRNLPGSLLITKIQGRAGIYDI